MLAKKKPRVNGCRKKRSVPDETEPQRVEVQTEENPTADDFQAAETLVKVHTEEVETVADEFQTKEAHVEVHIETEETQTEIIADEFRTEEDHVKVHIQT